MINDPFDPNDPWDIAVNEARETYIAAIEIAESTFRFSDGPDGLMPLFETHPARAALMTAKRIFGFGEGILTKVMERNETLFFDYARNEKVDPGPVLRSLASMYVALEMHSLELNGYRAALAYCQLVDETDSDEYDSLLKDIADQTNHIADVKTFTLAKGDQFLAELTHRKTR